MPILENIKQDPFERLPVSNVLEGSPAYFNDFYAREFWRFVYVQQKVGELAQTAIEFPPMQKGASPRESRATNTQIKRVPRERGARSFNAEMVS